MQRLLRLSQRLQCLLQRALRLALLLCAAVAVCAAAAGWWYFPDEDAAAWRQGAPPHLWSHRLRNEARLGESAASRRSRFSYVPLGAMSPDLRLAVLVAEDVGFFSHGSVDVLAQWEALQQWWLLRAQNRRLRGASTISQQLAKNLFLSSDRSLLRKVQELRMACWLERHLGKARVFELYCNVIELGPHIYGVDAAARYYFNVTAAELDARQAALLAASIPGPMVANPRTQTRLFEIRRAAVETRMRKLTHLKPMLARLSS
jgi:monofunctional biosynthetic peptidoglycan transglycosylase